MPLKGHQRSERQKTQAVAMQKRRWLPKSHTIDPANRRLLSQARKKHLREMGKVKKSEYNARRRERRTQEELGESQAQLQEAVEAVEVRYEGQLEELRGEKEVLKREVARLNAHVRREPSKIQHAVQKALGFGKESAAAQLESNVHYVKDKYRVVKDWARNAMVMLVNEGIAISKTWPVVVANAKALGVTLVGKWSTRTSGRVVREGGVAAALMIVEYVLTSIGSLSG